MIPIKLLLFGLSLAFLTGCDQSPESSKKQRMQLASESKNNQHPIIIGVPWTNADDDRFIDGVKLAVKEVNRKGGVLDKTLLEIVVNDAEANYSDTRLSQGARRGIILKTAKSFAANPDLIAVIGHASSETSMIASVVYQNRGILFLAPNARFGKLTGHNFSYTFRTSLNNGLMGRQLADYAAQKGYKHIAVLSARTDSNDEFVNEFTTYSIEKYGTEIVYRRSFFENNLDIISLVAELKSVQNMDAVCIAAGGQKAAQIYQQIRNVGIKLPVIGNASLDTKDFLNRVKQWEYSNKIQKTSIPTLFTLATAKGRQFDQQFQHEYGKEADYLAALGYDSVNLLAHAIQYAKSKVPLEIATTLRYMDACKGVTGKYEFELNGDLKNKPVSFYHMDKGNYIFERVNNGTVLDDPKMEICNEVDRDHDGIPTASDECPDTTPAEMRNGVNQDGAERGCPIDGDNDGVPDYKDSCPKDSPAGISKGVDVRGCPVDFDKDGIADYQDDDVDGDKVANLKDHCPKSTPKEKNYGVNLTGGKAGCPVDTDADGVLDYLDSCRTNTKAEISQKVDKKGCPADLDADGVLDYQDKCLKTPDDLLVDKEGCELLRLNTLLKPVKKLFEPKQAKLTKEATKALDELLDKTHLDLLKKVEVIGYAKDKDKALFQAGLQKLVDYLKQKAVPLEKIQSSVKEVEAKKNKVIEVIFSEVQLADETSGETDSDTTKTPDKPEADNDDASSTPKAGALVPTAQPEAGRVVTPTAPKPGGPVPGSGPGTGAVNPESSTSAGTPSH